MTMTDKRTASTAIEPENTNESPNNNGGEQDRANDKKRIRISVACGNCKKRKKRVSADKTNTPITSERTPIKSRSDQIFATCS